MCPKIHTEKKEYESPEEVQVLKILISTGDSYFKIQSLKVGINRQPLFFVVFCHKLSLHKGRDPPISNLRKTDWRKENGAKTSEYSGSVVKTQI